MYHMLLLEIRWVLVNQTTHDVIKYYKICYLWVSIICTPFSVTDHKITQINLDFSGYIGLEV